MKKLATAITALTIVATPAFAADMAVKAPPALPAPVYNWTGWYVGGNVGYSWGDARTDLNEAGTVSSSTTAFTDFRPLQFTDSGTARLKGAIGGAQIGYNYQADSLWVLGFETDLQISGERGSRTFVDPFATSACSRAGNTCVETLPINGTATTTSTSKIEWFGTVRGRVGRLFGDQILVYGTGGLAYGRVQTSGATVLSGLSFNCSFDFCPAPFAINGSVLSAARTNVGFSAGAGVEGKLGFRPSNWTWKLEYLYVDLGSLDAVSPFRTGIPVPLVNGFASGTTTLHTHFTDNIVRVGLNYQFH